MNWTTTTDKYLTKAEVWMRIAAGCAAGNYYLSDIIDVADELADAWEERFCKEPEDDSNVD